MSLNEERNGNSLNGFELFPKIEFYLRFSSNHCLTVAEDRPAINASVDTFFLQLSQL